MSSKLFNCKHKNPQSTESLHYKQFDTVHYYTEVRDAMRKIFSSNTSENLHVICLRGTLSGDVGCKPSAVAENIRQTFILYG